MERIAIIRSASSPVSKSQYNIQEIGLAKELAKIGMQVDVFLISDQKKTYTENLGENNRVTVYWLYGIKIPGQQGYYPDLKNILDQHNYAMIQALDDSQITTVLVSRYCKKRGIKFVLWQGMYENYPEKYKRLIQYIFDWTFLKVLRNNTHYCIAKTNSARRYLENKKFKNITTIPVGLELANFDGGKERKFREELGIPADQKIILYVGKVEERRKPIFCIDVYRKVKAKNKQCCLVYVGQGPMIGKVHDYVVTHGVEDVHFVDRIPQNELPSLYAESSLFILPTRYEIFGMVLMEAMYFGCPVITYKAAGPLDVISNSEDGIVMDTFDEEEWANQILKIFASENCCNKMGKAGQEKIKRQYQWNIIAQKYYARYQEIIHGETKSNSKKQ